METTFKFDEINVLELDEETGDYIHTDAKNTKGSITKTYAGEVQLCLLDDEPLLYNCIKSYDAEQGEESFEIWDCLTEDGEDCSFYIKGKERQIHLHHIATPSTKFKFVYVYMLA